MCSDLAECLICKTVSPDWTVTLGETLCRDCDVKWGTGFRDYLLSQEVDVASYARGMSTDTFRPIASTGLGKAGSEERVWFNRLRYS